MNRGKVMMIIGVSVIVINWVISAISPHSSGSIKGISGYLTIIGWAVFLGGFGLLQLDKRKSLNQSKK